MNDQNDFKPNLLNTFSKIKYPKIFLSAKEYYNSNEIVNISYYKDKEFVGDMYTDKLKVIKDFNLIKWVSQNS